MQQFTAYEYLLIDVANHAGLDKKLWDERTHWTKSNMGDLESLEPDDPKTVHLYRKAVNVLRNIDKPTGFIMALDSTNSGAQVMAALGKCGKSAMTCNLINTGNREDLYGSILNKTKNTTISRQTIKEAIIPMLYGSKAKPIELFGEGTAELKAFNQAVHDSLPVLGEMRALMDMCWNSEALKHQFVMPDGHVVVLPTMVTNSMRVRMLELKTSFTYVWKENAPDTNSTALLAHVTHATDAYVAREMVRRCNRAGFQVAHIHDSLWTRPGHMNQIRQFYVDILVEIAKSNLLEDIMEQLIGKKVELEYTGIDLWKSIKDSEYALS